MTATAYIGIGSNLGDKLSNCLKAIDAVDRVSDCSVVGLSDFYRTEPVGVERQDWYVNGVLSLSTGISPQALLTSILAVEKEMGRKRNKKWDSRIIDLDLLLFGQDVIKENGFAVPHPLMHRRRFVLMPMVQLAPDLIHPVLGKSMADLLDDISGEGQTVIPMTDM